MTFEQRPLQTSPDDPSYAGASPKDGRIAHPDMTGTLMLSRLVRDDGMKYLVFTGRIFTAIEGATLGVVTRLAQDPVADALAAAADIAGRSPSAVRGAKQLMNRISNAGAAEHFAAEREIIFMLIGKPHQVEAITANFEKRAPVLKNVG